jgi:serine/threonine protein kinase
VRAHLSRGRSLDVYEVWNEERGCLCIVKTLRPDCIDDRSARGRLLREGDLLLELTHPHIVRAYEVVRSPVPAVVLETLSGATLAYIVKSRARRLPVTELAVLGVQLSSAVAYIHRHGYLHLDLKPSNVVCEDGLAKLIDLSITRTPGRVRKCVGTRPYMAPEQAQRGHLTEATDVWGLGVLLYEAATGRRPYAGADAEGSPQLDGRPPSVRAWRRLPTDVGILIDACLETDANERPALAELTKILDPFVPRQG